MNKTIEELNSIDTKFHCSMRKKTISHKYLDKEIEQNANKKDFVFPGYYMANSTNELIKVTREKGLYFIQKVHNETREPLKEKWENPERDLVQMIGFGLWTLVEKTQWSPEGEKEALKKRKETTKTKADDPNQTSLF